MYNQESENSIQDVKGIIFGASVLVGLIIALTVIVDLIIKTL